MFGIGSKRIGITLDQTGVRYVILKKKDKSWVVDINGFLPIQEGTIVEDQIVDVLSLNNQLKAWVKKEGLNGAIATISVPTSQIIIRRMNVSTINPKEVGQLVDLEVETTLHLPFEDPIYDYVKVGTDEVSTQLFIYAAPKKLINTYVKLMQDAGIKVNSAELSATALARAIALQQDESFSDTMLISMDEKLLEIYMFHDGYPIFMRDMSLEENDEDSIKGELSVEQVSEVTAEISRMLNFYQYSIYEGASRITRIILTGSTEGKQQLHNGLKQSLPDTMDIQTINFTSELGNKTVDEYRVAMGLALYENNESSISLIPRISREDQLFPLIISIMLIIWILGAGTLGYFYYNNLIDRNANDEILVTKNQQKTILESQFKTESNGPSGGQTNPEAAIAEIQANKQNVAAQLKEINDNLPPGALIRRISYTNLQITLTVNFNNIEDSSKYLFDLRASALVNTANLQSISESGNAIVINGQSSLNTPSENVANQYTGNFEVKFKNLKKE
ncbi:fimbrial protein [Paenibacillus psychroresistens]|uniref:Fimbrial protein n=1 Tax=Paenibacillus psychroresistens TaxID=1778678 RepID=A0A6B8RLF4_9BACL|nr:pilus assembly protein PilM [Paenibacillus psychroresistens]QGQ96687.1 fimbrial protein [Paenibacillus psychroresistens]